MSLAQLNNQIVKIIGEQFKEGEYYLDIKQTFSKKLPKYTLVEATGWASETLIIITTKITETGAKGPSFWFEVTSGAFVQLAS